MKVVSETHALQTLHQLQTEYAREIREKYEHRAKDCLTCETPGACCLDAHFVNVRITRLEAVAIRKVIESLPPERRRSVLDRVEHAINAHKLSSEGSQFYACPLFEKGTGCLVHDLAKPLPCIAHACYENKADLPPDELLIEREARVGRLNESVYRSPVMLVPIPIAIK